jgi:carboxyl-terminal processing protease
VAEAAATAEEHASKPSLRQRVIAGVTVLALVAVVAFGGGVAAGRALTPSAPSALNLALLNEALSVIQNNYVDKKLDLSALSAGTVDGMVKSLNDPFSLYLTPDEYRNLTQRLGGTFGGIGTTIQEENGQPTIVDVVPGSPAAAAHVRYGDVILSVDGQATASLTENQIVALVRGQAGTQVTLVLQRGAGQVTVRLTRATIQYPTVRSTTVAVAATRSHPAEHVFYVRIYEFDETTADQFATALKSKPANVTGVVLDLRGNGGGLVDAADQVIAQFVPNGVADVFIDRSGRQDVHRIADIHSAHGTGLDYSDRLVVLVDGDTASASEIVTAALRDNGRAEAVGVKTYGKGSAQNDFPLSNGGDLHLTTNRWYTPDMASVNGVGITPDEVVPLPDPAKMFALVAGSDYRQDAQLLAALELLPTLAKPPSAG